MDKLQLLSALGEVGKTVTDDDAPEDIVVAMHVIEARVRSTLASYELPFTVDTLTTLILGAHMAASTPGIPGETFGLTPLLWRGAMAHLSTQLLDGIEAGTAEPPVASAVVPDHLPDDFS